MHIFDGIGAGFLVEEEGKDSEEDRDTAVFGGPGEIIQAPKKAVPGCALVVERVKVVGDSIAVEGPGILAFDGERERTLKPGQTATMTLNRDGPRVIDVPKTMNTAACNGLLRDREVPNGD